MLSTIANSASAKICDTLLEGEELIAFPVLIKKKLPNWFIEHLNLRINPSLNDYVKVRSFEFDLTVKDTTGQLISRYKQALNDEHKLNREDLTAFTNDALSSHVQILIDPVAELSTLVFDRQSKEQLSGRDITTILTSLEKIVEWRGKLLPNLFSVIKPYLSGMNTQAVTKKEFSRTLSSALEKEIASDPFAFVEIDLKRIRELAALTDSFDENEFSDLIEDVKLFLVNRGLSYWTPAITVESAINDGKLSFTDLIHALKRLQVYRDSGLIGVDTLEQSLVDDEVDNFTNFVDMVSA